jgi:hypothetical protein
VRSWDIAVTVASIVAESIAGIDDDATCQRTSRSSVSAGASIRATGLCCVIPDPNRSSEQEPTLSVQAR